MTTLVQMPDVQDVKEIDAQMAVETLYTATKSFAETMARWDGEEVQRDALQELADYQLTPESRAQIIFHLLVTGHHGNAEDLNTAGKQFAVVLAETMGSNWAQWLYNFAKVVTKLA